MATVSLARQFVHSDPPAPTFPRLADCLVPLCPPVPAPSWAYNTPSDATMTLGTARQLADYERYLAKLDADATACEMSARADEVADELMADQRQPGRMFGGSNTDHIHIDKRTEWWLSQSL